jgi:signal transduction histidine kinase
MSLHFNKITDAISKSASLSVKEKTRLLKELEKTEQTLQKKDTLLSAQARELEIEAALEKVRARSMAMHNSEEIAQVAATMFLQLTKTGINDLRRCVIYTFNQAQTEFQCWYTTEDGKSFAHHFSMPLKGSKVIQKIISCWKSGKPISIEVSGSLYTEWGTFIRKHGWKYPKGEKPANRMLLNEFPFKYGLIEVATYSELKKEDYVISARFTQVFEQVYTRFLDLQKAEAQAREAQIEAALERVRSRSMAMYKSEELAELSLELVKQVQALGVATWFCAFNIYDDDPKGSLEWGSNGQGTFPKYRTPMEGVFLRYYEAGQRGETLLINEIGKKECPAHYDYLCTLPGVGEQLFKMKDAGIPFPTSQIDHVAYFKYGYVLFITYEPSPESHDIFKRFAKVFEQTYTRFLDLQKAEAQAREAQIEAALEKVRSSTMAMHKSEELAETALVLYKQFSLLGNIPDRMSIGIFTEETREVTLWPTDQSGSKLNKKFAGYWDRSPIMTKIYKAWKAGNDSFIADLSGEELKKWLKFIREEMKLFIDDTHIKGRRVQQAAFFSHGFLLITTNELIEEEIMQLLIRFAGVFSQTYTRFLDLQKAEAQAREAQIENALEKVRSQSLAMHATSEMQLVANAVYDQLHELGLEMDAVGMSGVIAVKQDYDVWVGGVPFGKALRIPYNENTKVQRDYNKMLKERPELFAKTYTGKVKEEYINHLLTHGEFPKALKKKMKTSEAFTTSIALARKSSIQILRYTNRPYSGEDNEILKRFAKVFEQAYIRFMDLKKAEAQARASQIEVALERVRSRAMAMHHTDELTDVLGVLFDQFDFLGINPVLTHLTLFDEANETFTLRITRGGKKRVIAEQLIDVNAVESWKTSFANWKKSELHALDCIDYPPELLPAVWQVLDGVMTALPEGQKIYPEDFPNGLYTTQGHCKYGYIGFNHSRRATEEEKDIVIRFAKEFGRLYQRFLDIQKAELQAREAQIEGALERVRSKTMAMHNSEDLEDIVVSLFDEVVNLGLDKSIRCGIGILEGHKGMETRSVNKSSDGTVKLITGMLDMTIHPMLVGLKKAWEKGSTGYSYHYTGKDVRKYYEALNKEPEYPMNADLKTLPEQEFHRSFFFSSGIIFAFSENPISEESSKILARFAAVFGQTYQRFMDLQKAEERAKEAVKQASLDRVRGQIASMRSAKDLERITPLVWNELTTLRIPFIRCGVFIIEESNKTVQAFLSAPDGRSLGAMRIPFDADKNTAETVVHWQKGEVYRTHWDKRQFLEFMQTMMDLGQVNNNKEYQGAEEPPESLHLHFVPFTQGMLYVGNVEPLAEDQIESVQSLAEAFAIAYARYEDFHKLEKAKERVEVTLSELKATQNQLVQSEKMASLGELTAGIAHEIQNPLNFVNNFSEVSKELIEEMLIEMQKGDVEEVKALADDIIQNLEKIHHHGQRADGIVKGMLQHSRASSGEKEPTDLNVLVDEYLRLAYHGLRAKDKSFNATLETHFDESIGKVNVLTQDMGRVILNLITNAFYVVKEKKEQHPEGYEPTVTVSTKNTKEGVQISVKDNGNGIPEAIKEKIFQPFFTTKPTGQGTGLGLSMSYDIITKGHGGELEVNTKEGEGSVFTISIPLTQNL